MEDLGEDRYLITGFDQGQVIFFDIKQLDAGMISRYDISRHKILQIREIPKLGLYLFYEETNMMRLCELTSTGTKQLHTFNLYRSLYYLLVLDSYVYLTFE